MYCYTHFSPQGAVDEMRHANWSSTLLHILDKILFLINKKFKFVIFSYLTRVMLPCSLQQLSNFYVKLKIGLRHLFMEFILNLTLFKPFHLLYWSPPQSFNDAFDKPALIVIYYLQFSDFIFHSTNEIFLFVFLLFLVSRNLKPWIRISEGVGKGIWEESEVWAGLSPLSMNIFGAKRKLRAEKSCQKRLTE